VRTNHDIFLFQEARWGVSGGDTDSPPDFRPGPALPVRANSPIFIPYRPKIGLLGWNCRGEVASPIK